MPDAPLPYDPRDRDSIVEYATLLIGRTLRDILEELPPEIDFMAHKGGMGTALERLYFRYEPNSNPEPDFPEAGIELKVTPLKKARGRLVAKERLVLSMIDYMTIASEEWESSSFLKKNSHILMVFYLHEVGKDPRDYTFKLVKMWDLPAEDLEIIRQDWQTIADKVRAGLAHEISEGDTNYLSACTKAAKGTDRRPQPNSSEPAKPRAYSLKSSYMTRLIAEAMGYEGAQAVKPVASEETRSGLSFETAIAKRFEPFIGWNADEIAAHFGVPTSPRPKNFYALLTKRILGLGDKEVAAEFLKADILVKTMRLLPSGRPKEDVSFPAFKYLELVEQEWDSSDLRESLTRRFFFVIYRLDSQGTPYLEGTRFWTMPVSDIDTYARECFEKTVDLIREDKAEYLPKKSENPAVHVRPHARNAADVYPVPSGRLVTKKSFWLNGSYIKDQLGL